MQNESAALKRIPFDSICIAAVVAELQPLIGASVRSVMPIGTQAIVIEIFETTDNRILLSWDPQLPRVHLSGRMKRNKDLESPFVLEVRRRLLNAQLDGVKQIGFDRIVELSFTGANGVVSLVHELIGTRTNTKLLDSEQKIRAVARNVKGVAIGTRYVPPARIAENSIFKADSVHELQTCEGVSPFLLSLVEAGMPLTTIQDAIINSNFDPCIARDYGCYPVSVDALGYKTSPMSSFSLAAEMYFESAVLSRTLEEKLRDLRARLLPVLKSREKSVREMTARLDDAEHAAHLQLEAALLLAHATTIDPGTKLFEATNYYGEAIRITLNPDLSVVENATERFDKAKRAKQSAPLIEEQLHRIRRDIDDIRQILLKLETASLDEIEELGAEIDARKWFHKQGPVKAKEDRPYEGKRIREFVAEGGWLVLVGENAESNEYLTLRVAKPDDWWLHVRGASSSHVVIPTRKKPEKVPMQVLLFAAKLAARFSSQKHAGIVAVDYTLKKYVRRPRSAPMGSVTYEREKTLHVERE